MVFLAGLPVGGRALEEFQVLQRLLSTPRRHHAGAFRPKSKMKAQELTLWYGTLSRGLQALDFGIWAA